MNLNNESKQDNLLSINDAARRYRVTRQAIYVAIRDGRLNAKKIDKRWWIDIEDLKSFEKNVTQEKKVHLKVRHFMTMIKAIIRLNKRLKS